jgi:hypothetical protein
MSAVSGRPDIDPLAYTAAYDPAQNIGLGLPYPFITDVD